MRVQASTSLLVAAAAGLLLPATAASAQSMPQPWSGGYVSVFGGYQSSDDDENETLVFDRDFDGDFDDTVRTFEGADAFGPGSCGGAANSTSPAGGCSSDKGGVEGGFRVGYDFAFSNFVVGALAEVGGSDFEDSVTSFSTTPASYTVKRKLEDMVAVRLRAGYAFGPALAYATGGYARATVFNQFNSTNGVNLFTATVNDDKADGWQGGGGLEYQLAPHLSVFGEYLYTSLDAGDFVVRFSRGAAPLVNPFILPPNTAGTDVTRSADELKFHAFRIGMSYRF